MITALFSPLVSVAHAVTISMSIPGASTTASSTPGAWVANFYQFALMIGGVLAFGVVVYGGVKYMASAGNPSGQSDAKEWIEAALLGLLLLVGAYFILNVVNPQLTNLTMPTLQTVNISAPTSTTNTCTELVCGSLCCISGLQVCSHLGGTATTCVIKNNCPVVCGTSCCAATQKCIQQQASQYSPVIYSCL
jgi:hypothetical protein